ncbi:50S ribosomal protein L28 [Candidatus Kuenenbacteria bacterium]|nr:50S ribosomal protein L28 [Candidatus Kuenenbacteria bacterium]
MATRCEKCGKGPRTANMRSHSKIATKRKQYPNLQSKKVDGKKMVMCTRCIKTLNKV